MSERDSQTHAPPFVKMPRLPVPPPLRGIDTDYTKDSIARRLPEILQRTLAENNLPETAVFQLNALRDEIPGGKIRRLPAHVAPDLATWQKAILPFEGQTWLEVPWFFVETYFYRRIIAAIDHFRSGIDPFRHQKQQSLQTSVAQFRTRLSQLDQFISQGWQMETFRTLLLADLWGNQADMSLWAAGDEEMPNHVDAADQSAHLLVNDEKAVAQLLGTPLNRLDFMIDNAGFELIADLCLTDYLLATKQAETVHFHLKLFPTFVSDATPIDVEHCVAFLNQQADPAFQATARRLIHYLISGRLRLNTDPFWTSPHPLWQMPHSLRQELSKADLIISKGDANYRRALGDAAWPHTTPFASIVSYMPKPALFLRTCKSEVLAGLTELQLAKMGRYEKDWLVNGRWGVIQLA